MGQALFSLDESDEMSSRLLEGIFLAALLSRAFKTGLGSSSEPVIRQNWWTLHNINRYLINNGCWFGRLKGGIVP